MPEVQPVPDIQDLLSTVARINGRAWDQAYLFLWDAGTRLARRLLDGQEWVSERKDATAKALNEIISGLIGQNDQTEDGMKKQPNQPNQPNRLNSFAGIECFNDLKALFLRAVRCRIYDVDRRTDRGQEKLAS
ncbi:MAG: hypothetical protein O3C21_08140 [Verrucomicrobia bacterium]|nr:hypothetical protein [Verrucomicrobiota bacterium]